MEIDAQNLLDSHLYFLSRMSIKIIISFSLILSASQLQAQ